MVGVDHNGKDDQDWRDHLTQAMQSFIGGTGEFDPAKIDQKAWAWLTERMFYHVGDFEDPAAYTALRDRLASSTRQHGTRGNVIFYLAVADRFFGRVVDELGKAKLVLPRTIRPATTRPAPYRRVVIEKPFGHDLVSARELNGRILKTLEREPDLPHRSFPREGDGAEHHDVPLRQRPVRALVEPRSHRSRADHSGRDGGRRGARQFLRGDRGAARHGAQPCLPAALHDRHGAAHLVRRRCDPFQEGGRVPGDQAGRAALRRARAV